MRDISPALPATIQVAFQPYACGADWSMIPIEYHDETPYTSSPLATNGMDGYAGTLTISDTAHAVYNTTGVGVTPINSDVLTTLLNQIALDHWSWRLYAFDRVYTGIAAPAPDGLVDSIRWEMTADSASTRIQSAPWDSHSEQLNHSDYLNDCEDCVVVYDGPTTTTGSSPSVVTRIPKAKICMDQGQLVVIPIGSDSFGSCCTGSCVYTAVVLSAATSAPIVGATVVINGIGGTGVLCSGTTDSTGTYTCSVSNPSGATATITVGSCSKTFPIDCGITLTVYQCTGSVDFQAVDDTGANITGPAYFASPCFGSVVLSMTGGTASGGSGSVWYSTTPGTAVFCYFGIGLPTGCGGLVGPNDADCVPSSGSNPIGIIGIHHPVAPQNYLNADYWDTCDGDQCVYCGSNPTYAPIYYRRSEWIRSFSPCSCNCATLVDHGSTTFLPKILHVTIDGPTETLGTDAGVAIELNWDTSSWDGNSDRALSGGPNPVIQYLSSCHTNGAGGYCVSGSPFYWTYGEFIPYGSSRAILQIYSAGYGIASLFCAGASIYLLYQNYWDADCTTIYSPCSCPPNDMPTFCPGDPPNQHAQPPAFCWFYASFGDTVENYPTAFYPQLLSFDLKNSDQTQCGFQNICSPIDLIECSPIDSPPCTSSSPYDPNGTPFSFTATVTE